MRKTRRKLSAALLAASMVLGMTACGGSQSDSESASTSKELNIYIWSEYIPDSVIDSFEEEYGVTVNVSMFTSTDELLSKVMTGGASDYDVIQPNTYNIPALRELDYIQELDFNNIPNYQYVDEEFKADYVGDGDEKYAVPYMSGITVVAYNKNTCPIEITEMDDLLDPALEGQIVSITSSQSIINMVNAHLGFDPNTTNEEELAQSGEWLQQIKPNIKVFDGDAPRKSLLNGECSVGIIYGGDLALAMLEQPDTYVVCDFSSDDFRLGLGTTQFCVTKDTKNKELAEKFINWIHDPEIYAECLDAYPYMPTNSAALEHVTTFADVTVYDFSEETRENLYSRIDLGDASSLYDDVWSTFMNQ